MFRCDRHAHRHPQPCTHTSRRRGPRTAATPPRPASALDVTAVAVDEDEPALPIAMPTGQTPPARAAAPRCRWTSVPGKPRARHWRRSAIAGARGPIGFVPVAEPPSATARATAVAMRVSVSSGRCGSVLFGRANRDHHRWRRACAAASTSSSRARWGKPPADGRPNSPGVPPIVGASRMHFISEHFPQSAAGQFHASHVRHACTRARRVARRWCRSAVGAGGHAERTGEARRDRGCRRQPRSWTDARPRPISAESMPPRRMSSTFSTPPGRWPPGPTGRPDRSSPRARQAPAP